jgi:predicted RNase H-like nuclease
LLTGRRSSSIFPVPCRAATRAATYEEANRLNREVLGAGLSRQSWHICPKIREVDEWLQAETTWHGRLREAHPEVCFWALNGGEPMQLYKKEHEGRIERQRLLTRHWPQSEATYVQALSAFPRKLFQPDDLLDALVLALTAAKPERLVTLPDEPIQDAAGLPMEIVYRAQ